MQKDPFVILGVSDQVTQNELYEAYIEMRRRYEEKRFSPGKEGEEACEKLQEIDDAYRDANEILKTRYFVSNFSNPLQEADDLIRQGKMSEAQDVLDRATERTAEWHYLQSMIFYKKGWAGEARTQLKMAVDLEPGNPRYTDALNAMDRKAQGQDRYRANDDRRYYSDQYGDGRSYRGDVPTGARGCTPCDCCSSLICADCCCECMGGDLISCC